MNGRGCIDEVCTYCGSAYWEKSADFSMLEDQRYILDQMLGIFEEQRVDGILIAGDVYDKVVPSAEAVQLFDEFITRLAKLKMPVYMISGNHDSGGEAFFLGAKLFESSWIFIFHRFMTGR